MVVISRLDKSLSRAKKGRNAHLGDRLQNLLESLRGKRDDDSLVSELLLLVVLDDELDDSTEIGGHVDLTPCEQQSAIKVRSKIRRNQNMIQSSDSQILSFKL